MQHEDGQRVGSVYQDVVLSEVERGRLAEMAAGLDDPWLASQLLGMVPPPPTRRFHIPACWVGIVLTMLGTIITLAAVTQALGGAALWGTILGIAVMSAGVVLLVAPRVRTNKPQPLVRPVAQRGQWAPRPPRRNLAA